MAMQEQQRPSRVPQRRQIRWLMGHRHGQTIELADAGHRGLAAAVVSMLKARDPDGFFVLRHKTLDIGVFITQVEHRVDTPSRPGEREGMRQQVPVAVGITHDSESNQTR
jgi:hypothetical protein